MRKHSIHTYLLLCLLILPVVRLSAQNVVDTTMRRQWVDSVLNRLSTRERVAQLFMVACFPTLGEKHIEKIRKQVKEEKIGGIMFSVGHPTQIVELGNQFQVLSEVPMLFAVDGEWGPSMRVDSTLRFPRQMTLGAIENIQLIYDMGAEIAKQCKAMGIHINFAPVVDINNNANNPVINTRSFGERKEDVADKSMAYMRGMQDNGVMASAKHFPGHGDTDKDSHRELPVILHSKQRLDSLELYPFRRLVAEGVGSVMVGHLDVPTLDTSSNTPSSLSKKIITDLLRNELGFKGLIFTDALNMKAISATHNPKVVPLLALMAGVDVLLQPGEVASAIDTIVNAVDSGLVSYAVLDEHCRRILEAKYNAGLYRGELTKTEGLYEKLNSVEAQALIYRLVEASLTLVSNRKDALPLQRLDTLKLAYLEVGKGQPFADRLGCYASVAKFTMPDKPTQATLAKLEKDLAPFNFIIVGYHEADSRPQKNFGIKDTKLAFIEKLSMKKRVLFNFFGTPYAIAKLNKPEAFAAILVSNNNYPETQDRSAQAIFGAVPIKGRLPVGVSKRYPEGWGIELAEQVRLKYALPEELGVESERMLEIDSLILHAIELGAMPGCQVVAAHKGVVFYNKSFGRHTYEESSPTVKSTDLYDVASVTKVTATLPSVMKLVDERQLGLDDRLGQHLANLEKTNKADLVVRDILTHQSGLQAWILYYKHYLLPKRKGEEIFSNTKSSEFPLQLLNQPIYLSRNYFVDTASFSHKQSKRFSVAVSDKLFATSSVSAYVRSATDGSPLEEKVYRYSDMGLMYMQRLVEQISKKPLDVYTEKSFYAQLGMTRTSFNPLKRFPKNQIIPSEKEDIFLQQTIQGTVHDPAAAMLGGVSGHAGLFSTANDLAKLCQLYLNKGTYGGERYVNPEIIEEFTRYQFPERGNRRALGFDKPDLKNKGNVCPEVSNASYGHSGFTGTFIWIDPERELVFVFLSNRTYPTWKNNKLGELNVRTDLLSKFINSLDNKKVDLLSDKYSQSLQEVRDSYQSTLQVK